MTWEHWTIAALWVLGACASAVAVHAKSQHGGIGVFLALLPIWPGVVLVGVVLGLLERLK